MNVRPKDKTISGPYGVKHEFHVGPADLTDTRGPFKMQKEMEIQKKLVEPIQEILVTVKELHKELVHYKTFVQTEPKSEENIRVKAIGSSEQYRVQTRNVKEHKEAFFNERECLANALQFHVEIIVDGIVFHESELLDSLLAEGCLTEDECAKVRKLRDRKDQIRILLSLIKGRDLRVLKGFVKHIKNLNRIVAAKIQDKFEDNMNKRIKSNVCSLCQLKNQFNVKHIVDSLWANELIDDGLYKTIIHSESPVGAQCESWSMIIQALNDLDVQRATLANEKLLTALRSKDLFPHLADGVETMLIKNNGKLVCSCQHNHFPKRRDSSSGASTSITSFLPDSSSDGRQNDSASSFETQYGSRTLVDKFAELIEDLTSLSRKVSDMEEYGYIEVSGRSGVNYQTFSRTAVSASGDISQAITSTTQYDTRANPYIEFDNTKVTLV